MKRKLWWRRRPTSSSCLARDTWSTTSAVLALTAATAALNCCKQSHMQEQCGGRYEHIIRAQQTIAHMQMCCHWCVHFWREKWHIITTRARSATPTNLNMLPVALKLHVAPPLVPTSLKIIENIVALQNKVQMVITNTTQRTKLGRKEAKWRRKQCQYLQQWLFTRQF